MSFRSPDSAFSGNRSTEPSSAILSESSSFPPLRSDAQSSASSAILSKSSFFPHCRSDAQGSASSDESVSVALNSPGPSIRTEGRRFTYSELLRMTNEFETILGEWSSGTVYHGRLDDIEVAVYLLSHPSAQDYNQFSAELEPVLRVNQRNFVCLVGYCYDGDNVALIYEFMANGDLKEHLSGGSASSMLTAFLDELASRMAELTSENLQSTPVSNIGTTPIGVKLNGTNYGLWAQVMEMYISSKDKLGFINGGSPQPTSTDPSYWKWRTDDAIVKSWIIDSMETSLIGTFIGFLTAKQVWDAVATTFCDGSDRSRIYNLQCQVAQLKQNGGPLEKFYNELQGLWREIDFRRPNPMQCSKDIKIYNSVVQEDRVYIFLDGLDDSFNGIQQEVLQMRPFPNVKQAYSHVSHQVSRQRVVVNEGTEDMSAAFLASGELRVVNGRPGSNARVKNKGERSRCSHCACEQNFSLVPAEANNMHTREPTSDGNGNWVLGPGAPGHMMFDGIGGESVLTWETGIRIAVDAAQGLEYLHYGSNPPMFKFILSPELAFPPHRSPEPSSASLSRSSSLPFPFPTCRSDAQSMGSPIDSFNRLSIDQLFPGHASSSGSVSLSFNNPPGSPSSTMSLSDIEEEEVDQTLQINGAAETKAQSLRRPLMVAAQLLHYLTSRFRFQLRPQRKRFPIHDPLIVSRQRIFTFSEVRRMTNNFKRVLGEGGFGRVYHGHLYDTEVAVKLLSPGSTQGYREFMAEVELSSRVRHKNLVSLVGYCYDGGKVGFIYEFMANGDLNEHLSGRRGENVLTWETRIRIAVDAAQGLEYLHYGCKPPVVHRDVKPTTILLNEHFQAKISDFGLSIPLFVDDESPGFFTERIVGTYGYMAPEYAMTGWVSEKIDVYSFGAMLFEIITDQHWFDFNREEPRVGDWVGVLGDTLTEGDITRIVDPKLGGDYDREGARKALELAMTCANRSPAERPTMRQVVRELYECLPLEMSRGHGGFEMDSEDAIDLEEGERLTEGR